MKTLKITLIASFVWSACSFSRHWSGSNLPGTSYATFDQFSGKQAFKMKLNSNVRFTKIKYGLQLEKGKFDMIVIYQNKEVINLTDVRSVEDSIQIEKADNLDVEVLLTGKMAKGSYHIELKNL